MALVCKNLGSPLNRRCVLFASKPAQALRYSVALFTRQELPKPEKLMGALGVVAQNWLRAMEDSPITIKVMRKRKPTFKLRKGWNQIYAKRSLGR